MEPASTVLIVVPCCEAAAGLDRAALEGFIERTPKVRFLFVGAGSAADMPEALQCIATRAPQAARVVQLEQGGKAEAVRQGMLVALSDGADFVGYWDAKLATALDVIPEFVRVLTQSDAFDLVLGARVAAAGRRIDRRQRQYRGRVLARAASLTLNFPVHDAQCGAEVLRVGPHTRALFVEPFDSRAIFDVEIIARYISLCGTSERLCELALPCGRDAAASRIDAVDFARSLGELANLYRRYDLGQNLRPLVLGATGVFSRYVGVGGLGTATHYALLIASVEWLGFQPQNAAVLGAGVGAVVNYFLNYTLTFASHEAHRRALPKFALVALLGALASGYGVRTAGSWGVHYLWAQIVCTLLVLIAGFFLNRAWTFAARSGTGTPTRRAEP